MLNFNPELSSATALTSNMRSVAAHFDDDYYIRDLHPGLFIVDGTNATFAQIPAATPQWPAIKMPDAVVSIAVSSWRKPKFWVSGRLRLQFRYTSDVDSTSNFAINYRVLAIRRGEVLPGTVLTASPTQVLLAGPAVANTEMVDAYRYTTISMDGDDERLSLQVFRFGTSADDTNVNAFFLTEVEVLHIPAAQEVHVG